MAEHLVQAEGLACSRDGVAILEDINLTIDGGEIVALIGPNGCGKTTLLETICGTLPAAAGKVSLLERPIGSYGAAERARQIGFVPQREEQVFEFTVRETAAMGRLPYASGLYETDDDWQAVDEALDITDLTRLRNNAVTRISGGELQRVLIARAQAQQPKLLILDEPTASLDMPHYQSLSKLLRTLAGQGTGIIAASHDINWAMSIATTVVCLGEDFFWQGPPAEAKPALERAFGVKLEPAILSSGQTALFLTD